jgi:predicted nucleotidyltransferase
MSRMVQIEIPKDKVEKFCRRHAIRRLSIFGSVLRDDFGPDSDVDVLVEFEPEARHSFFDLVRMQGELAAMFGRKVDLVEAAALRNPFRRYEIMRTQQVIFDA